MELDKEISMSRKVTELLEISKEKSIEGWNPRAYSMKVFKS